MLFEQIIDVLAGIGGDFLRSVEGSVHGGT